MIHHTRQDFHAYLFKSFVFSSKIQDYYFSNVFRFRWTVLVSDSGRRSHITCWIFRWCSMSRKNLKNIINIVQIYITKPEPGSKPITVIGSRLAIDLLILFKFISIASIIIVYSKTDVRERERESERERERPKPFARVLSSLKQYGKFCSTITLKKWNNTWFKFSK